MSLTDTNYFEKLRHNLPWLARYPFDRAANFFGEKSGGKKHIIITIANHFEPAWSQNGILPLDAQRRRLDEYFKMAREIGEAVRDADDTKFRHTNFYPAEQYDFQILETMAAMQSENLGEVEIHLHHGVEKPDTAENLRKSLTRFRDILAVEHKCLSLIENDSQPKYAFVHGNLALANSANGKCCGVDNEMQILAETGCYIDLTLPSAPVESQVAVINKIYECGLPLNEPAPHRKGKSVVGRQRSAIAGGFLPDRSFLIGHAASKGCPFLASKTAHWLKINRLMRHVSGVGRMPISRSKIVLNGFLSNFIVTGFSITTNPPASANGRGVFLAKWWKQARKQGRIKFTLRRHGKRRI